MRSSSVYALKSPVMPSNVAILSANVTVAEVNKAGWARALAENASASKVTSIVIGEHFR